MTMSSTTTAPSAPLTREQEGGLFGQTMGLVAVTAGFFALGAYLGRNLTGGWAIGSYVAALVVLLALNVVAARSEQLAITLLFGFGVLFGLAVAPTINYYVGADPQAVWQAGGATALFIAGFGAAGYATRRDLSGLARACFWALVGLIVFGIVLIFVQVPHGALIYAILGLVIFAGLTLFDFQRLRRAKDIRTAPLLAASIFLDVVNVFLLFLQIFSNDR
jgi:FtsH-binding integral membrane protein